MHAYEKFSEKKLRKKNFEYKSPTRLDLLFAGILSYMKIILQTSSNP